MHCSGSFQIINLWDTVQAVELFALQAALTAGRIPSDTETLLVSVVWCIVGRYVTGNNSSATPLLILESATTECSEAQDYVDYLPI
jgi:hypothetical protein